MHPLVDELIQGIAQDEEEAFIGAGEIAAASHFGFESYQVVEPYADQISSNPPTPEDIATLKNALIEHIESGPMPTTGAAFALGKFHDPALTPVLRCQLAKHLQALLKYNAALSNLLCALHNSGEKIHGNGTHSLQETDAMIADARQYLAKHGMIFPW